MEETVEDLKRRAQYKATVKIRELSGEEQGEEQSGESEAEDE